MLPSLSSALGVHSAKAKNTDIKNNASNQTQEAKMHHHSQKLKKSNVFNDSDTIIRKPITYAMETQSTQVYMLDKAPYKPNINRKLNLRRSTEP